MNELFGTDGIRSKAGSYPLDPVTVFNVGSSLGRRLRHELGRGPRVIIGRDTRASGAEIEAFLSGGILAEGGSVRSAGIVPTPAVGFLAGRFQFDCGIVVSASHNPHEDNGIKIFSPDGKKIDDRMEDAIAADIKRVPPAGQGPAPEAPIYDASLADAYRRRLIEEVAGELDLRGVRMVVDCANGSASAPARRCKR